MGVLVVLIFAVVPCAGLFIAYFAIFRDGARSSGRWGVRRRQVSAGDASPYRTGELEEEVPRGAPWWLRVTSGLSVLAGVGTAALLAPMGLLLMLIAADKTNAIIAIFVFLVSSSGFAAGVVWVELARCAVRHERFEHASSYLYLHHGLVALVMLAFDSVHFMGVALFSVPICVFAVGSVALLDWGSRLHVDHARAPSPAPLQRHSGIEPTGCVDANADVGGLS